MKKIKLNFSLPENFQEEDHLYFKEESLTFPEPKIKVLDNVFMGSNGVVLRNYPFIKPLVLVKESIYRHRDRFSFFREQANNLYQEAKKTGDIVHLDKNSNYISIVTPWSFYNYYHWIHDSIPRLLAVYNQIEDPVLILWDFYDHFPYIKESLKPFKKLKLKILKQNQVVLADRIILPELRHKDIMYDPAKVEQIREIYSDYFGNKEEPARRIYITRKNAEKRKAVNENEVEALMRKYDFTILDFDDMPFDQQVSTMNSTKFLVTIHGAGLANIVFLKKNASVLELHRKKKRPWDIHNKTYWYLSNLLGLKYYHQTCDAVKDQHKLDIMNFFYSDFYVDVAKLEENLKLMLSQS